MLIFNPLLRIQNGHTHNNNSAENAAVVVTILYTLGRVKVRKCQCCIYVKRSLLNYLSVHLHKLENFVEK